jgi:hypothetical protein
MAELGRALGVREDEESSMEVDGEKVERGTFGQVQKAVEKIVREGYSAVQVLSQVRLSSSSFSLFSNIFLLFSKTAPRPDHPRPARLASCESQGCD